MAQDNQVYPKTRMPLAASFLFERVAICYQETLQVHRRIHTSDGATFMESEVLVCDTFFNRFDLEHFSILQDLKEYQEPQQEWIQILKRQMHPYFSLKKVLVEH